jgi:hypothetical protein
MESMVNGRIHGCNISGHLHRQKMLMGETAWWNAPTKTENGLSANTILKAKNIQTIFMDRVAQRRKFQYYRFYMVHTEGNEIIGTGMWQSQDKTRRWQEDWSNQITAIHIQKANLHLTAHIPCAPRCSPLNLSTCCTSHPPKERLQFQGVSKKRVAPDLLPFRNNGVCYSPQIVFPSQEVRMGRHTPSCGSQAHDRLHGCPCQRICRWAYQNRGMLASHQLYTILHAYAWIRLIRSNFWWESSWVFASVGNRELVVLSFFKINVRKLSLVNSKESLLGYQFP